MWISSPAVVNGIAYFGSGDGNVYAVDANSGVLQWKYGTGDVVHEWDRHDHLEGGLEVGRHPL